MDISYNKLSIDFYNEQIRNLLNDEKLIKLGIKRKILGYSTYGYPIDLISVGHGFYDLFVVGGTHSSEIITVDFILQLLKNISDFEEFDPNFFTIKFIPIQNPEGFDICTSVFSDVSSTNFQSKSMEYFLRYRTDYLIFKAINDFNSLYDVSENSSMFLSNFKSLINNNVNWKNLSDKRAFPNIKIFNNIVNSFSDGNDFTFLFTFLSNACLTVIDKINSNDLHDSFLYYFMNILNDSFTSISKVSLTRYNKLHQMMFKDSSISLKSPSLNRNVNLVYSILDNPKGSIITHDSTGRFINLNANNLLNPGISCIKNNILKYGIGPKSNVRNYFPGPLGMPCLDVNNFKYTIENKLLYNLLKSSYDNGKYLAILLYHGTGGMIYYKPYQYLMSDKNFSYFFDYNNNIADIYNEGISSVNDSNCGYKKMDDSGTSGYGDLLRRIFPGVLLIELSRMGGNPIAPYGDCSNIYNTLNENFLGFKKVLNFFKRK